MYYVDKRTMEVFKDLDTSYLAPEEYYEYRCGSLEDIITETWYVTDNKAKDNKDNKVIDFAFRMGDVLKNSQRAAHFKLHGVTPHYLRCYTVPPSVFNEIISEM